MDDKNVWKAMLAEFLGTFILVFVGAGAVALSAAQGATVVGSAFAFGLSLLFIVYIFGSISGGQVNPAVTLGQAIAGKLNWLTAVGYWIAQFLGGLLAAALIAWFFGTANGAGASIGSLTNSEPWKALLFEAILTFFLVLAILYATNDRKLALVSGLIAGAVLSADMLAGAPLTGASMNPARSLGTALFGGTISTYWVYFFGPMLGALVAALLFRLMNAHWSIGHHHGKKVVKEEIYEEKETISGDRRSGSMRRMMMADEQ